MTPDTWTAVDQYVSGLLIPQDPALDAAQQASHAAGLPAISVSAAQGKLLHLIARIRGARRVLEIGTLGGYSTIWLARALAPGGRVITLEFDPKHADVARANVANAGLSGVVEIRVGRAIDALPTLAHEDPFDLIFIDADKASTAAYFTWALRLSNPGAVIIVDNVVRDGRVIDPSGDDDVQGMRRFLEVLAAEARVSATVIQTVGVKGYDGFAIAVVS